MPNKLVHITSLSFIASKFGRPLLTDIVSAKQGRLNYVRVYVKLDLEKRITKKENFMKVSSKPYKVYAEYEWLPLHCNSYKAFSQMANNCQLRNANMTLLKANMALPLKPSNPTLGQIWQKVKGRRWNLPTKEELTKGTSVPTSHK